MNKIIVSYVPITRPFPVTPGSSTNQCPPTSGHQIALFVVGMVALFGNDMVNANKFHHYSSPYGYNNYYGNGYYPGYGYGGGYGGYGSGYGGGYGNGYGNGYGYYK